MGRLYMNLIYVFTILLLTSCSDTKEKIDYNSDKMEALNLNNLQDKGVYFGHQSVGVNILNGLERFVERNNFNFQLSKESISPGKNKLAILHSAIGKNGEPLVKIEDYKNFILERRGENIDVSIFKLCYSDIYSSTDLDKVFEAYTSTIDSLQKEFPKMIFVHATVPLRAIQRGPKAFVKKILGRSIGYEDNIARNKYNNLIRKKYSSGYVFDIAKFESTKQDGSREEKMIDGVKCYSLVDEYTYDGGHLTTFGEDYLGKEFFAFLTNINLK